MTTRATCAAELRDEAETWVGSQLIREALRDLADVVETQGRYAAETKLLGMMSFRYLIPGRVLAYETALEMIRECEED